MIFYINSDKRAIHFFSFNHQQLVCVVYKNDQTFRVDILKYVINMY